MAQYNTKENYLKAALSDYYGLGFRLKEPDDHVTELYHLDKCIARYNPMKLTFVELHKGCQAYLDSIAIRNN